MTTEKFRPITSLYQFETYCVAKGLNPYALCEIPEGMSFGKTKLTGFFANVPAGTANKKDFTQIGLQLRDDGVRSYGPTEWVRLSFKDCDNDQIINS